MRSPRPWCWLGAVVLLSTSCTLSDRVERYRAPLPGPGVPGLEVRQEREARALPAPAEVKQDLSLQQVRGGGVVTLEDVLAAVDRHFPELAAARQEIERAEGALLAAQGGFDPKVKGKSKLKREFYEHETAEISVDQPLPWLGSRIFGGYRFGGGSFASYDGDLITNDAGEARIGFALPLVRDLRVDERRAAVWRARLQRDAADPIVQEKRVSIARKASLSYWKWVATGKKVHVAADLLRLANTRQEQFEEEARRGQVAEIKLKDNLRLVFERRGILAAAQRDFEMASLMLSLYLRDGNGNPLRLGLESLPPEWPPVPEIASEALEAHILYGLRYRPEVARIAYEQAQLSLDLELGRNQLLPRFDLEAFVAQDFGGSATSKREYDPTVYNVGLAFELPVLQRKARGKLQQTRAKLSKLGFELRMLSDSIEAEVRDSASAYRRALERIAFARRNYALALELEEAERVMLRAGASDLIRVNIREQSTAKSRSSLVEAEALAFIALADYRASLGLPRVPEGGLKTDIEPGVAPVRREEPRPEPTAPVR